MVSTSYLIILVLTASIVTIFLRAVPFIIFNGQNKMPNGVKRVADLLPTAIMGVLVVYCFKGYIVTPNSEGIAAIIAAAIVVLIHLWKKNTLLSIALGTAVYMILIRII